jgi:hypothetical protein
VLPERLADDRRVAQVTDDRLHPLVSERVPVDDGDRITGVQQGTDNAASDEPDATCHENLGWTPIRHERS